MSALHQLGAELLKAAARTCKQKGCNEVATHHVVWADGRGIVATCPRHLAGFKKSLGEVVSVRTAADQERREAKRKMRKSAAHPTWGKNLTAKERFVLSRSRTGMKKKAVVRQAARWAKPPAPMSRKAVKLNTSGVTLSSKRVQPKIVPDVKKTMPDDLAAQAKDHLKKNPNLLARYKREYPEHAPQLDAMMEGVRQKMKYQGSFRAGAGARFGTGCGVTKRAADSVAEGITGKRVVIEKLAGTPVLTEAARDAAIPALIGYLRGGEEGKSRAESTLGGIAGGAALGTFAALGAAVLGRLAAARRLKAIAEMPMHQQLGTGAAKDWAKSWPMIGGVLGGLVGIPAGAIMGGKRLAGEPIPEDVPAKDTAKATLGGALAGGAAGASAGAGAGMAHHKLNFPSKAPLVGKLKNLHDLASRVPATARFGAVGGLAGGALLGRKLLKDYRRGEARSE